MGKTGVSVTLAKKLSCAIINADSRQLFQEMAIGTAKPTPAEMQGIKHYFVNDRSVAEEFSAGRFAREALQVLAQEFKQQDVCIMSGGSGLYIDAVCQGLNDFPDVPPPIRDELNRELAKDGAAKLYAELMLVDPVYAREIAPNNSQRIVRALEIYRASGKTYSSLRTGIDAKRNFAIHYIGLEMPREELYDRINQRMDAMIAAGLFAEARALIPYREKNALQTVGYNEVFMYYDGLIDKKEAIRLLKRNSRRYAKRQMTWFKKNRDIAWFHPREVEAIYRHLQQKLHA